jgi:hypothetical protein
VKNGRKALAAQIDGFCPSPAIAAVKQVETADGHGSDDHLARAKLIKRDVSQILDTPLQ